jgi:hypothetical protein
MKVPLIHAVWESICLQSCAKSSTAIPAFSLHKDSLTLTPLEFKCSGSMSSTFKKKIKIVQVQITYRNVDRSPITCPWLRKTTGTKSYLSSSNCKATRGYNRQTRWKRREQSCTRYRGYRTFWESFLNSVCSK